MKIVGIILMGLLLSGCATTIATFALLPTVFTPQLVATSIASGAISGAARASIERAIKDGRARLWVSCRSAITGHYVALTYAADNPTTTVCSMRRRAAQKFRK